MSKTISLTPGFSPVIVAEPGQNRFNGLRRGAPEPIGLICHLVSPRRLCDLKIFEGIQTSMAHGGLKAKFRRPAGGLIKSMLNGFYQLTPFQATLSYYLQIFSR